MSPARHLDIGQIVGVEANGAQFVHQLQRILNRVDHAVAVAVTHLVARAGLEPEAQRRRPVRAAHECMGDAPAGVDARLVLRGMPPQAAGHDADGLKATWMVPGDVEGGQAAQ